MKTTVKLTGGGGSVVFKIREQRVKVRRWKKLLYFFCKCGHKGQYEELNVGYGSCPKCKSIAVEVLEKCPQCGSSSTTESAAGIVRTITSDDQVWEVWPCKKCQTLLKNKSKKFLGFIPHFLFY